MISKSEGGRECRTPFFHFLVELSQLGSLRDLRGLPPKSSKIGLPTTLLDDQNMQ